MNERMYELINQCFIGTTDGKLSDLNTVANVEKFAELVVRECARIVVNNGIATANHDQMVRQDCINEIKEHFGIEE